MKTFDATCAQGDVLFVKVAALPDGLMEIKSDGDQVVITHSETGHDHVMELDRSSIPSVQMFEGDNPLIAWIKVNRPTPLKHLRNHDTHEPIMFNEGVYRIHRQREYTPEGFRRVED